MQDSSFDYEDLKGLMESLNKVIDVVEKIMDDGKVDLFDIRYMPELVREISPNLRKYESVSFDFSSLSELQMRELCEVGVSIAVKLSSKFTQKAV